MANFLLKCAVLSLIAVANVNCHSFYLGRCPKVEPVENFNMDKFLGRWYVVQKFSTASTCWTYEFTKNVTDGSLKVKQARDHVVLDTVGFDNNYTYTGTLDVPNSSKPGAMRVRFPMSIGGKADYVVFATDYDNYGAVYSCQKILFGHRRSASILSRTPTLDQMYINKVRAKLESFGVDPHDFSIIDQSNCKTLPPTSVLNFGVDPNTFTAENVAGVVRSVGNSIGNGIERAADGAGRLYNRIAGNSSSERQSRAIDPKAEVEYI